MRPACAPRAKPLQSDISRTRRDGHEARPAARARARRRRSRARSDRRGSARRRGKACPTSAPAHAAAPASQPPRARPAPAATAPLAVSSANTSDAGAPPEVLAGVPVAGVAVADRAQVADAATGAPRVRQRAASPRGSPRARRGRSPSGRTVSSGRCRRSASSCARRGPTTWINTAVPVPARRLRDGAASTRTLVLATLYFLVPYNLLVYGVNDVYDYESDLRNPRKASLEGANVPPDRRRATLLAVVRDQRPAPDRPRRCSAVGGRRGARRSTAVAAVAYSAPPLRTKERPVLDSLTSALHFVLPAVCGFAAGAARQLGRAALDASLAAFVLWGMASHALGAIQDVAYDRAARHRLRRHRARRAGDGARRHRSVPRPAARCWPRSATRAVVAAVGALAYAALGAWVASRPDEETARRAWRSFMGLNLIAGALVTELLLDRWGLQAAGAVPGSRRRRLRGASAGVARRAGGAARGPPRRRAGASWPAGGRQRLAAAADGNVTDLVRPGRRAGCWRAPPSRSSPALALGAAATRGARAAGRRRRAGTAAPARLPERRRQWSQRQRLARS